VSTTSERTALPDQTLSKAHVRKSPFGDQRQSSRHVHFPAWLKGVSRLLPWNTQRPTETSSFRSSGDCGCVCAAPAAVLAASNVNVRKTAVRFMAGPGAG